MGFHEASYPGFCPFEGPWGLSMRPIPRLRKGVVALAIVVFCLSWISVLPPAAAKGGYVTHSPAAHVYTVAPNGVDDTANIQAAFDGCASDGPKCTVQLTKGVFHTAQVVAEDFHGTFRGMSERWTMVEALPNLPSPTADPFWAAIPSPHNPWPSMFVFLNGSFAVSRITFSEPYYFPGPIWEFPLIGPMNELYSAILVVGGHADAAIDHVTVRGAAGDMFGSNMLSAIAYQGFFTKPGWTNPWADLYPISGTFAVSNSAFYTIDAPVFMQNLLGAHATVRGNTIDTAEIGFGSLDAYDCVLEVTGNRFRNMFNEAVGAAAVIAWQAEYVAGTLPSYLLVAGNEFWLTDGAYGVWVWEMVKTLHSVIMNNVFHLDATAGGGILSISTLSTETFRNEIRGGGAFGVDIIDGPGTVALNEIRGAEVGVWIESSTGVIVSRNVIKESGRWGIAVSTGMSFWGSVLGFTAGSTDTLVTHNIVRGSGVADLYWDQTGTGNVWRGNVCTSSDPPGLCSGH